MTNKSTQEKMNREEKHLLELLDEWALRQDYQDYLARVYLKRKISNPVSFEEWVDTLSQKKKKRSREQKMELGSGVCSLVRYRILGGENKDG